MFSIGKLSFLKLCTKLAIADLDFYKGKSRRINYNESDRCWSLSQHPFPLPPFTFSCSNTCPAQNWFLFGSPSVSLLAPVPPWPSRHTNVEHQKTLRTWIYMNKKLNVWSFWTNNLNVPNYWNLLLHLQNFSHMTQILPETWVKKDLTVQQFTMWYYHSKG